MYERFISSSMLTGTFELMSVIAEPCRCSVLRAQCLVLGCFGARCSVVGTWHPAPWHEARSTEHRAPSTKHRLDIQVLDVERVVFNKFAPGLDLVAHEGREHQVRRRMVFRLDLQER